MTGGDRAINILHVVTRLPVGGVENMLLKVVKSYDRQRFNVRVCCIKEGGEIADELMRGGYGVDILNRMKKHGFDLGAVTALCHVIKKNNVHILRTHQYHANLYGRIAGVLSGVPVMIPSFHNLYVSPDKPKIHRRVINWFLSLFSDALVPVSHVIASDLKRYDRVSHGKIRVIYNGIDPEAFSINLSKDEARDVFKLPRENILIGTVGRLTDQKGHRYLIEAVSGMSNINVAIAGDGPLKNELKDLAGRFRSGCYFSGRLKPDEIPLFLRALDVFCFPSLWEGMPSSLTEAMAAGLPVIASDIAPNREVLGDAGILVQKQDPAALAEKIKQIVNDSFLRNELGEKAKKRADIFSINRTVNEYESLFEEILIRKNMHHEI